MERLRKIPPSKNEPSGFTKEIAQSIFNLNVGSDCFSFRTPNIKSWKAYFYFLRKLECKDKQFTFSMDTEKSKEHNEEVCTFYNVWRIK